MAATAKELTGRKVLFITLAAFGVIVGVNFTMAFLAVDSFPGLEVKNIYVASQSFDKDRAAQTALGWTVKTGYSDGTLTLSVTDANGNPAAIGEMRATVGRATHDSADVMLNFTQATSPYSLALPLDYGKWELRMAATAADGTAFRQRLPIIVNP